MTVDTTRVDELQTSIREGQLLLQAGRYKSRPAIERSIRNSQIRLERVLAGLPEGKMQWDESARCWRYEFEPSQ